MLIKRSRVIKTMSLLKILTFSITLLSFIINIKGQDTKKTFKIDKQIWMEENLNVSHFQNGDVIPEAKTDKEWEKAGNEGKPAWCYYDNKLGNGKIYGKLYNWYAINDLRGLAPRGWHIPTYKEFDTLSNFVYGKVVKTIGQGTGVNSDGLPALFAGARSYYKDVPKYKNFIDSGTIAYFWMATKFDATNADGIYLNNIGKFTFNEQNKGFGYSVRCIKD